MLIKVKVFPYSKKEEVIKKSKDSLEVRVKEKPVMGLANKATIRVLASYLNIAESKIRLVRGFKQRNKIFDIPDSQN